MPLNISHKSLSANKVGPNLFSGHVWAHSLQVASRIRTLFVTAIVKAMENMKTTYIMLPMRADSKLNSGSVADLVLDCQYGAIWPAIICPLINFSISLCNNPIILSFWSYLIQRLALWQLFNRIPVYFVTLIPFDCDVEMFVWICRNMQIYLNFMLSLSTGPTIKLYLYHHYGNTGCGVFKRGVQN